MRKVEITLTFAAAITVGIPVLLAQTGSPGTFAPDKTLADVSVTYSALKSNAPPGGCGCFWSEGGSAELAVPLWRYLSGVAELSGEHAGHVSGSDQTAFSLISGLGGIRIGRPMHMRFTPFAQGLFGGVHAFDSYFAGTSRSTTYATAFALAAGGGLDVSIAKHLAVRPVQAEYQYMQLPNGSTNEQHDVRLSAGAVFRFTR